MALREFTDSNGTAWTAWDIRPPRVYSPVRSPVDRRQRAGSGSTPERRANPDRRRRNSPPELAYGWVCFESEHEKRRLVPPPPGWESCGDRELEELCRQASPQRKKVA